MRCSGSSPAFGLTVVSDLLLDYQDWLRVGGAGFLLYVGIRAFTADPLAGHAVAARSRESCSPIIASTFALTITNPITILAFLAIFAGIGFTGARGDDWRGAAILVLGVWLGSLLWWAALALGAGCCSAIVSAAIIWSGSTAARAGYWCSPASALLGSVLVRYLG